MRRLLPILLLLFVGTPTFCQTTVNLSVTDTPDNQTWNNGTWTVQLVNAGNPGQSSAFTLLSGGGSVANQSGTLSGTGTASMSLPANVNIGPGGTKWQFVVCPQASAGCFISNVTIGTSSPQTVALTPPSIRINLTTATPPVSLYATGEVTQAVLGSQFFLIGTGQQFCTAVTGTSCNTWGGSGGGLTSVPGVFNSSFDPPLFQNYSLTTTGAQAGINLTANPIDTHSMSWQLTSNGLAQAVTDSFSYANGDLHTANASWVYAVGTFNVNSNAAFGSAAASFSYRNDGPLATANEYSQATLVETVSNVTQNHGPCVRMSTSVQTGYCLQLANDIFRLIFWNAGSAVVLADYTASAGVPKTGDVVLISVISTTIRVYKNGACLAPCGTVDTNLATGATGLFSNGNANSNGVSSFQSGTIPSCTVGLDQSPDGTTWTTLIAGQNCALAGSISANARVNFVRVNLSALTAGQTLNVVYNGRYAPTGSNTGPAPVSNGQWVNAGEVIWTQVTQQGVGNVTYSTWVRILTPTGVTISSGRLSLGCNMSTNGGYGSGYIVPSSGWLQAAQTQIDTGGFPQGTFYVQHFIMFQMPVGGSTTACGNILAGTAASAPESGYLDGAAVGSFYMTGFTGTSAISTSPWVIPGFTNTISVSNPAAGADWSFAFPTGLNVAARQCIQSVSFTVAAGSTNVTPVLILTINGVKLVYPANTAQTSATTQTYSFSPGSAEVVTAGTTLFHVVPFNNGQLACFNSGLTTATISTLTTGINGTTQYSAINILTQLQQDNN